MRKFNFTRNSKNDDSDSEIELGFEERTASQGEDRTTDSNSILEANERCRLSNTAPSKVHLKTVPGIDYLAFWVFGKWGSESESLFGRIENAKLCAQKEGSSILSLNGIDFLVSKSGSAGRGTYRCTWQLQSHGIYFGVCNNQTSKSNRPLLKVELKGSVLTQHGVLASLNSVEKCLKALGLHYETSLISRADIKVDQFGVPIEQYVSDLECNRLITRSEGLKRIGKIKKTETLTFGRRSTNRVVCRIYDKLAEIQNNKEKFAIFYFCIAQGEVPDSCTRIEFEVRREGFKNFGISSIEDFFGRLGDLTEYLSHHFFRIADKSVDRNHTERSKVATHWQAVQQGFRDLGTVYRASPSRAGERIPMDPSKHKTNVISHLLSWMIKEGIRAKSHRDVIEFTMENLVPSLQHPSIFEKYEKKCREITHQNGVDVGAFFENQSLPLNQIFTGLGKVPNTDLPPSSVQTPKDLFLKDELLWTTNKNKAA